MSLSNAVVTFLRTLLLLLRPHLFQQVPYTFYVKDTEVMESLEQTVSELGERSTQPFAWNVPHKAFASRHSLVEQRGYFFCFKPRARRHGNMFFVCSHDISRMQDHNIPQ